MVVNVYFGKGESAIHGAGIVLKSGEILHNRGQVCPKKIEEAKWTPLRDKEITASMAKYKTAYNQKCRMEEKIKEAELLLESLKQKKEEIEGTMKTIKNDVERHIAKKDRRAKAEIEIAKYKGIDENELISYSLIGGKAEDKYKILAIIRKSKKPCTYTYGFEYRHPTTYRVPITKEQAEEYLLNNSMVDARVDKDAIRINEYSENDMW